MRKTSKLCVLKDKIGNLDADDLKETTIEAVHPQPDKELDYDIQGLFL